MNQGKQKRCKNVAIDISKVANEGKRRLVKMISTNKGERNDTCFFLMKRFRRTDERKFKL